MWSGEWSVSILVFMEKPWCTPHLPAPVCCPSPCSSPNHRGSQIFTSQRIQPLFFHALTFLSHLLSPQKTLLGCRDAGAWAPQHTRLVAEDPRPPTTHKRRGGKREVQSRRVLSSALHAPPRTRPQPQMPTGPRKGAGRLSVGSPRARRRGSPPSGGEERGRDARRCRPHTHAPEAALRRRGLGPGCPARRLRRLPAGEIHRPSRPGQGQMQHLPRLRRLGTGGHPAPPGTALAGHDADTRNVWAGDHADGQKPSSRRPLGSLFFALPDSYLRLQLYLKRQSLISPVADFCPEPRRCRLRAGSLTPRAGRQRATAASTVPVASEARRCRGGLGGPTSTWAAPELTPGMPAAVPWGTLQAEGGVSLQAFPGLPRQAAEVPLRPGLGEQGRPTLQGSSHSLLLAPF